MIPQVLDSLLRTVHLLPESYRADLHQSLQGLLTRVKRKEAIRPMTLIVSLAPVVQDSLQLELPPSPPLSSDSTLSAMLTDSTAYFSPCH